MILLDVWLPGMDGLEALSRLQASQRPPAVIMISGHGTIETAVRATKLGAFDFIEKPLSLDKIIVLVRNAIQQRRLQEENQLLRTELGHRYQVIGESVPMKALRQQIAVTAPTNGRVLIYGESGTGKELVARALHAASLRSKGLFVEVNCAAIPEELIESELFGHVKGSFAGAAEDKIGKFKKADGGTLFLDEVGDMSLRTQSKVLRVLEEQRFEPVGSSQALSVDVRVLAATNKNLEQEIARGAFRQDLFYRLNANSLLRAAAPRPQGRHSHSGPALLERIQRRIWKKNARAERHGYGDFAAASVAGKHSRAAQRLWSVWLSFARKRASSRTICRRKSFVASRRARSNRIRRCTKRAARMNENLFCVSCRNTAGT